MKANNNTETISIHSPKNRYRAEIRFNKAVKELGSVVSFTHNNIYELQQLCSKQVAAARVGASVKVIENVDVYPRFDWQDVAVWKMNELGCLTSE